MSKWCSACQLEHGDLAWKCKECGNDGWIFNPQDLDSYREQLADEAKALGMKVLSVDTPQTFEVLEELGTVFGVSSKQAFWGLSKQSNRLARAYDAALIDLKVQAHEMGADAIVGLRVALNNSQGSSASGIAGSSEAVVLLGTAVRIKSK